MTAEQREATPQDQAEQTLKIAEGLLKLVRGKTSRTFYSIGTSDIENVCKAYLTLSTQLARLEEKISYLSADCRHTSTMRKDVHSPWVCAACGVLIKQFNGAGEKSLSFDNEEEGQ